MSDRTYAKAQTQQKTLSGLSPKNSLLQRTCACGQHTIAGAECSTCRSEQSTWLRSQRAFGPPSAPGAVPGNAPAQEQGSSFNSVFDRTSRFGHDFSQIPIHPPAAGAIQTKLIVDAPGDIYEQEADRISQQVMRMPEPQLERSCACGGGCPRCQTAQSSQVHERLQTKRVDASDLGQAGVPPIVHEVLRSSGQPLDTATRAFMEPRFGHDFSRVRVHLDSQAAASARDVDALAYTVGRDIVFAHGQFAPHTASGQRLLAHELAHTLQQGVAAEQVTTWDLRVGQQNDPFEHDAEKVSTSVLSARVGVSSEKPPGASVRPGARHALRRQLPPTFPKKEEVDPTKTTPAAPAVQTTAESTKPCSPETGGSTGLCSPQGVSLAEIKAMFLQMKDPPKDLILGLTQSLGGGTLSELSTKPSANPKKVVLQELTATPSCCSSFYTLAGTYRDTVIPKKGSSFERVLIIKPDGGKKIFEGEKEHCDDIKYAFDISLGHYKKVVNDLAKRKVEFVSQDAAEKEVTRLVDRKPATWADHYSYLLKKTDTRDTKSWHTAGGKPPPHEFVVMKEDPDPKTGNLIAQWPTIVNKDSFPDVGNHPTPEVIK